MFSPSISCPSSLGIVTSAFSSEESSNRPAHEPTFPPFGYQTVSRREHRVEGMRMSGELTSQAHSEPPIADPPTLPLGYETVSRSKYHREGSHKWRAYPTGSVEKRIRPIFLLPSSQVHRDSIHFTLNNEELPAISRKHCM